MRSRAPNDLEGECAFDEVRPRAHELAHGSYDEIELRVDGTLGSASWSSLSPNVLSYGNKTDGIRRIGMEDDTASVARSIAAIYAGEAQLRGVATFSDGLTNARAMDAVRAASGSTEWKDCERD